jgi:MFS family permease
MPTDAGRRSLLYLGCAVVLVDTLLYAALTPLLPRFTDELGLSKALAGILVAAYPFGALAGGVPGGIVASRIGPQRTVVAGLTVFCASTIVFAFANDFALLLGARIAEGVSSALTWAGAMSWLLAAAPRERRGELVGTALGAAVFGALVGPGLGAAAAFAGRGVVFTIVAAVGAVLIPLSLRETDAVAREHASLKALVALWRNRRFVGGLTLMAVTAMLFGLLTVIAPLHLADVGWSAGGRRALLHARMGRPAGFLRADPDRGRHGVRIALHPRHGADRGRRRGRRRAAGTGIRGDERVVGDRRRARPRGRRRARGRDR